MRLSLKVNGVTRFTAAVSGSGFLSAHVNLQDRPKENDFSKSVHVAGIKTSNSETVRLSWPTVDLSVGDVVQVTVLNDGEGDAPTTAQRSSESPRNLFSSSELAKELVELVSEFDSRLMELVDKSKQVESAEEHKRFTSAVGRVSYEVGESFLYPVYRRHSELMPEDLKGELL